MATQLDALRRAVSDPLPFFQWRRPHRTLRLCTRSVRVALRARALHGGSVLKMMARARRLLGRDMFCMAEILQLGLLELELSDEQCRRYQSREAATRMEVFLNLGADHGAVEDKARFYRRATELDIPVPRFWGEFSRDGRGTTAGGRVLNGRPAWAEYLAEECPGDLVVKPARNGYGFGVQLFHREADGQYTDPDGRRVRAEELVARLEANGDSESWVVQERITNHPDLVELSGSRYLQTLRVITMIDGTGRVHLVHAHCKLIVGRNYVDNFRYGATGNLIAGVDLASGRLLEGWAMRRPNGGFKPVSHHPTTDRSIVGLQLPDWELAIQLAVQAASAFKPLRMVGWDIALTPTGPILVEGNWNSDPPNATSSSDQLLAKIEELLVAT